VNASEFYTVVDGICRKVHEADDPYEPALEAMEIGMSGFGDPEVGELAAALYLIWGSLTDGIDGPRGDDPGMRSWAYDGMRRSAAEWLALPEDLPARLAWADRWVYDECGYERRDDDSGPRASDR
jgi:hypothetical protein